MKGQWAPSGRPHLGGKALKKNLVLPDLNLATHWMNYRLTQYDLSEKPLLIHFWSISCGHCRHSLPVIHSIYDRCREFLNVAAVHMPLSEDDLDIHEVAKFCSIYRMNEPVLIDNTHRLADAFGNRYVPAYYLFDKTGKLLEYHLGEQGVTRIGNAVDLILRYDHK